jgi:hypothetical protein
MRRSHSSCLWGLYQWAGGLASLLLYSPLHHRADSRLGSELTGSCGKGFIGLRYDRLAKCICT